MKDEPREAGHPMMSWDVCREIEALNEKLRLIEERLARLEGELNRHALNDIYRRPNA